MSDMFTGKGRGRGNVVFNFVGQTIVDTAAYGAGYRRAGKTVLEDIMARPGYRDNDCYPIFFLYRHALELHVKALVLRGAQLLELVSDEEVDTARAFKSHNLTEFLPAIRAIFKDRGWIDGEGATELEHICDVVEEVNKVDAWSYVFRYPSNKKGEASTKKHHVLNVLSYAKVVDQVLDSLDAAFTGLSAEWDDAAEVICAVQEILKTDD